MARYALVHNLNLHGRFTLLDASTKGVEMIGVMACFSVYVWNVRYTLCVYKHVCVRLVSSHSVKGFALLVVYNIQMCLGRHSRVM